MQMQITVNLEAPELAAAIRALAEAIGGQNKNTPMPVSAPIPAPTEVPSSTSIPTPAPAPAPAPAIPIAQPDPTSAPVPTPSPPMTPAPAPIAVPTAVQTYTMEQLAVAATQLVDAGRRTELVALLGQFGVQALTALPKEQYGNFATALRQMGAKI